MSTIAGVYFWNDVGYREGDYKVPGFSSLGTLPTPTKTLGTANINPAVGRIFSEMQIAVPYREAMNFSYLYARISLKNGPDLAIYVYGWVDSVEMRSDSEDYPMTVVRWHIDHWRTYLASASYSGGKVERAKTLTGLTRYRQPATYRYLRASTSHDIIHIEAPITMWVYLAVNYQSGSTVYTRTYCFPFYTQIGVSYVGFIANYNDASNPRTTIPTDALYDGSWTTYLGISLSNIKYACLSPKAPMTMTGGLTNVDPLRPTRDKWVVTNEIFNSNSQNRYVYRIYSDADSSTPFEEYSLDVSSYDIESDELNRWVITGFDGETIHEMPFGMKVNTIKYRTVVGSLSGYLEFRACFDEGDNDSAAEDARSNGICAVIPLIPLELSANSTSEYVYSGQRQYDIDAATTQRDKALVSGLLNTGSSTMSGALMGSLFPVGMGAGAVVGAATGIASAAVGYGAAQHFDGVEQGNRDRLAAAQPDTMLLSGTSWDFLYFAQSIKLKLLEADDESQDHFANIIDYEGYIVGDYVYTGFDTMLRAMSGGTKISKMSIGGNIPNEAKEYIKQRFANGVYLT